MCGVCTKLHHLKKTHVLNFITWKQGSGTWWCELFHQAIPVGPSRGYPPQSLSKTHTSLYTVFWGNSKNHALPSCSQTYTQILATSNRSATVENLRSETQELKPFNYPVLNLDKKPEASMKSFTQFKCPNWSIVMSYARFGARFNAKQFENILFRKRTHCPLLKVLRLIIRRYLPPNCHCLKVEQPITHDLSPKEASGTDPLRYWKRPTCNHNRIYVMSMFYIYIYTHIFFVIFIYLLNFSFFGWIIYLFVRSKGLRKKLNNEGWEIWKMHVCRAPCCSTSMQNSAAP